MKYTLKLIMVTTLGALFSCNPESPNDNYVCPSEIDLGDVMLIDSSLAVFPYDELDSKVIFVDSLNNEISFNLQELSTRESAGSFFTDCESNQETQYLYNLFYRYVELVNDSLDIRIQVIMTPDPFPLLYSPSQWNDILILEVNKPINSPDKEVLRLTINRRNNNPGPGVMLGHAEFEEYALINEIEFENVYWGIAESYNEEIKVFYNRNQGIVGIQNLTTDLSLAFDSVE